MTNAYKTKTALHSGTSYAELIRSARNDYHQIQKRTPRRIPYVRSAYFTKDKIFINNFWEHLGQKSARDRVRRLRLYHAAIELIRNSRHAPESMQNPNNEDELLHRFYGLTLDNINFAVQIKENKKTHRKDFISCFPTK